MATKSPPLTEEEIKKITDGFSRQTDQLIKNLNDAAKSGPTV